MGNRHRSRSKRQPSRAWPAIAITAVLAVSTVGLATWAMTREANPYSSTELARISDQIARDAAAENAAREKERKDKYNASLAQVVFPGDRPLSVQFLGDSITSGSYASAPEFFWWRQVEADLAEHGEVTSSVLSAGGRTAAEALEVGVAPADLTFVFLGQNERFRDETADNFAVTYPALLAELKAQAPSSQIVCISPWFARSYGLDFFDVVRDSCNAIGGEYVDVSSTMTTQNRRQIGEPTMYGNPAADDGHPNDDGMTAIADRVLRQLFYVPPAS